MLTYFSSIFLCHLQITLPNSDLSKPSTETLMTDLLMIDFMQKDIIGILMRKIKTLAVEEYVSPSCFVEFLIRASTK